MILLSASQSVRKAFQIIPVGTTPLIPTDEWYRFWRVDVRKIRGHGEIMLFTNHETLYTFVTDCRAFREGPEIGSYFMKRFSEMFFGHCGYGDEIRERILVHRAVDRSAVGVMNSFFQMIECCERREPADLEGWLNDVPIIERGFIPAKRLREKLSISA